MRLEEVHYNHGTNGLIPSGIGYMLREYVKKLVGLRIFTINESHFHAFGLQCSGNEFGVADEAVPRPRIIWTSSSFGSEDIHVHIEDVVDALEELTSGGLAPRNEVVK